jgi:hypothetical protein
MPSKSHETIPLNSKTLQDFSQQLQIFERFLLVSNRVSINHDKKNKPESFHFGFLLTANARMILFYTNTI